MFIKFLSHACEEIDFQISEHTAIWFHTAPPSCALMTKTDVPSPGCFDLVISLFLIWHSNGFGGFNARETLYWNECHWFMPSGRLPGSKLWGPFSSFSRICSVSLNFPSKFREVYMWACMPVCMYKSIWSIPSSLDCCNVRRARQLQRADEMTQSLP